MTQRSAVKVSAKKKKNTGGRLRIGDQWNAINIIARSQTHPLKAVCELTENAIDAGSKNVQILRRRQKGAIFLEVVDDGNGVRQNDDGQPDFARIATHVCDSMKRHLDPDEKKGVHGEFGIGLLSFWSLGEELRMVCGGQDGRLYEMLLKRGGQHYMVHKARGRISMGGTRVIVGPLLDVTKKVVTGEKVVRYLSAELRDRIRTTGVTVHVLDRVSRKDLIVTPREFEGDRLDIPRRFATSHGDVHAELYFRSESSSENAGIAVCKDGTRVLKNITELMQFQHAPWGDSRVEGILDFDAFNLAPGTRDGIVPDERLDAFVSAMQAVEPLILAVIEKREQAETDKASKKILKQVHRAFVNALRELPSNEYLFFDIPESSTSLGRKEGEKGRAGPGTGAGETELDGMPTPTAADAPRPSIEQPLLPLGSGVLTSVRISPRHARRVPGEECRLSATATDEHGIKLHDDVDFSWRIVDGNGSLTGANEAQCHANSTQVGLVVVEVTAAQDDLCSDQVEVKFLEDTGESDSDSGKGLPSYRLEPEHGKPWRSRYDAAGNEIIINSAHRDFLISKSSLAKHRRYVGKLYAKEVVLINFPHEAPAEVMERLIEITLRTEDAL
jgi:hypothetical protein